MTFEPFKVAVGKYVEEVVKLTDTLRQEAEERNQRLDDKVFQAVDDPTQTWVAPPRLDVAPYLNFAPLQNAVAALKKSTAAYAKAYAAATAGGKTLPAEKANRLNGILMKSERTLTRPEGLPRRSWYVHQIYAPGFYTGYGVKTLPAVREALEQRDWKEATAEMPMRGRHHRGVLGGDRQGDGGAGDEGSEDEITTGAADGGLGLPPGVGRLSGAAPVPGTSPRGTSPLETAGFLPVPSAKEMYA